MATGRAVAYGLAGGGVVVGVMALVYAQSREAFLSPVFQWSLVIVYLAAMVGTLLRRPPIPRGDAIRAALVTYLLVSACYYLYTYALYEWFDPELYGLQSRLMIENVRAAQAGEPGLASESAAVKYAPENLRYTFSTVAYSYALGALSGAAVAFLLGNLLGAKPDDGPGAQ